MKLTYKEWYDKVNDLLVLKTVMAIDDLPDAPTYRWYAQGVTPEATVKKIIKHAREF